MLLARSTAPDAGIWATLRTEDQIQMGIASYLRHYKLLFTYIANDKRVDANEKRRMKLMGLYVGAPDIVVWSRCPGAPDVRGICLEVKTLAGGPSNAQLRFRDVAIAQGYAYHIVRSTEDVCKVLKGYGFYVT